MTVSGCERLEELTLPRLRWHGLVISLLLGLAAPVFSQAPPIRFLEGHARSPFAVVWTPDGKTLMSGGFDGTVRCWDRETGKLLNTWNETGKVLSLALSRDGFQLAVGSLDRKLRLFDAPVRDPLPTFASAAMNNEPVGLVPSRDGTVILSADKSGLVRMWNASTAQHLRDFAGSTAEVTGVALTHDGQHVLASGIDGSLRIWNATSAQLESTLTTTHIQSLAVAPDGKSIATADKDGVVRTFQFPVAAPLRLATHGDVINGVALSRNGRLAVSAGIDQVVQVVQTQNGQQIRNLPNQPGPATSLALSPDDSMVGTGSATGIVKFWNIADGADLRILAGHEGPVSGLAFEPGGKQVVTVGNDATIRLWDLPQPPSALAGHSKPVQALAVSRDGQWLVTGSADLTVRLWMAGKPGPVLQGHTQPVTSVTISADNQLVASGDTAGVLRIWKPADEKPLIAEFGAHTGSISGVAFHPDGKVLLSSGAEGTVKAWDVSPTSNLSLAGHTDPVMAVAAASDGTFYVSGGNDQSVRLFDAAGKPVRTLGERLGGVTGVAVNEKSTIIAATTSTGLLRLWTVEGADLGTVAGHAGAIQALAFQPKTDKLATAGMDGTIRVWSLPVAARELPEAPKPVVAVRVSPNGQSVAFAAADNVGRVLGLGNGQSQAVLNGHAAPLTAIAWRADSSQLVTAGADKSVRWWTAANGAAVKAFEKLAADPKAVAITPDGSVILWGGADNLVHHLTTADGAEVRAIPGAGQPIAALFISADGQTFAAGSADGGVRIHRVGDGASLASAAHGAAVQGLAISPDGRMLASCGSDNLVKLWNAGNGAALATAAGHAGLVSGVSFAANNEWLASCSHDGTVRLWDLMGRCLQVFSVDKAQFTSVSIAPDNKTIVAGAADGHMHVFTVSFERLIVGHEGPVTSVAFSPNGQWVVSGGQDKTVRSWNVADGKQVFAFAGATDAITGIAVSHDSTLVTASSQDKLVRTWTLGNGQPVGTPITLPVPMRAIALSPDGKWAAFAGDDGLVRVFDVATAKELQRFAGHVAPVHSVAFVGAKTIASASADKSVKTWTMSARRLYVADAAKSLDVRLTRDGTQFLTSGEDRIVKLWDLTSGQLVRQYGGAEGPPRTIAIRPDGLQIAGGGTEAATDKNVYLWDFATGGLTQRVVTPAAVTGIAYSPDGTMVLAGGADNRLRVYRTSDGRLLEEITAASPITAVALSADGRTIAAGAGDTTVGLYRISLRRLLTGHEGPVTCVTFSPKGDLLLTGGNDRTVRVWSMPDGKQISALVGSGDAISSLAVTADGQKLFAGSHDRNVRLWNLAAIPGVAQLNPEFALPQASLVRSVAVAPDGTRLAVGGDDNQVHAWDLVGVKEIERFAGHAGAVMKLAFSGDGTRVISGSNDRTVYLWPLSGRKSAAAHQGPVVRLAYSDDGKSLLTGSTDKLALQLNAATLAEEARFDVQSPVRGIARSEGSPWVATVSEDLQLKLWKAGQPRPLVTQVLPAAATGVALSPHGDRVVVGCADRVLRTFALVTQDGQPRLEPVQECAGHADQIPWLQFDRDGKTAYSASLDRTVRRWQMASSTPRGIVTLGGPVDGLSFSPDGTSLAAAAGMDVSLIDLANASITTVLSGHTGRVMCVAYHPNGQFIASGSADHSLRLWSPKGEAVRSFEGVDSPLYACSFSTDGSWLLGGGKSGRLHAWNVGDSKLVRSHAAHNAPLYRVAVNPAGSRVASLDHAGELCIWDTAGNLLHHQALPVLSGHSLAYSPDGRDLAVASQDSRVLIVPIPPNVQ